MKGGKLRQVGEVLWEIAPEGPHMRVPARVIADEVLLEQIVRDDSLGQLVNVTSLPGVTRTVVGMPDMHEGYGFPVGGVAATTFPDGVISPGGIGFDINCGVRLLASGLPREELGDVASLVHELSRSVPTGYGRGGRVGLDADDLDHVLAEGAAWLVAARGMGTVADLEHTESRGSLPEADPARVSARAKQRGRDQLGTLGGGNHFLEVQVVDEVLDADAARALGLVAGHVTIFVHTGSRGLGHQVCTDAVREMDGALARHRIQLPDRQLACAPLSSREGKDYFAAMCAAANFAWANRQALTDTIRRVFARHLGGGRPASLRLVYDVAHNIAKLERFGDRTLCVHRKGATRAFGPSSQDLPPPFRGVGQPIFIPGSMGTASYVLVGTDEAKERSLASTCHGAGRAMSRTAAKKLVAGGALRKELEGKGIVVHCPSNAELAEEAPLAYKDVDRVVQVVARAGLARVVARLRPIGVLKG